MTSEIRLIAFFLNGARLTAPIERGYPLQRKEMYGMPHPVNDEFFLKKRVTHGNALSEGFSVRPYRSGQTRVPWVDQSLGKASSALRNGTEITSYNKE